MRIVNTEHTPDRMSDYLRATEVIDADHPAVQAQARRLAVDGDSMQTARCCFEWVRDQIRHSGDCQAAVTTCRASEVLAAGTGWCFAKSHLLAALLRANGIPTGLCYQRLRRGDGRGFTLHGLNAILLPNAGWYRVDARGNKPGVEAQFCPPSERIAWPGTAPGEVNFPEIWPDPVSVVVRCLREQHGWQAVRANLPDIAFLNRAPE